MDHGMAWYGMICYGYIWHGQSNAERKCGLSELVRCVNVRRLCAWCTSKLCDL